MERACVSWGQPEDVPANVVVRVVVAGACANTWVAHAGPGVEPKKCPKINRFASTDGSISARGRSSTNRGRPQPFDHGAVRARIQHNRRKPCMCVQVKKGGKVRG